MGQHDTTIASLSLSFPLSLKKNTPFTRATTVLAEVLPSPSVSSSPFAARYDRRCVQRAQGAQRGNSGGRRILVKVGRMLIDHNKAVSMSRYCIYMTKYVRAMIYLPRVSHRSNACAAYMLPRCPRFVLLRPAPGDKLKHTIHLPDCGHRCAFLHLHPCIQLYRLRSLLNYYCSGPPRRPCPCRSCSSHQQQRGRY